MAPRALPSELTALPIEPHQCQNSLTPIWILKSINLPRERWTFCQSLFSLLGHAAAADDDDGGGREWHGINLVLKTGKKFWEEPPTFKTFMNVRLGGGTYNENTLLRGDNRKSCKKPLVHRAENRVIFHAFKDSFSLSPFVTAIKSICGIYYTLMYWSKTIIWGLSLSLS